MTRYTIPEIAGIWQQAGGAHPATVFAVAICLAESGGDDHVISPSADYGLWQINRANFGAYGLNDGNWWRPFVNAGVAIKMSGNGRNWAPWCTAWRSINDCGHGFIAGPQHGSAAYSHVATVAAVLGVTPPQYVDNHGQFGSDGAPGQAPREVSSAWAGLQHFIGPYARTGYGNISTIRTAIRRI